MGDGGRMEERMRDEEWRLRDGGMRGQGFVSRVVGDV